MLDLHLIRIDGDTQTRVELDQDTVDAYADAYLAGAVFPPVTVFFDGKDRWLADGFHRYFAAKKAGKKTILEIITPGTKRDAILFSLGANGKHGKPPSSADKRNAIERMLNDPEWTTWSDNAIAKQCHVDHKTVAARRIAILGISQDALTTRTVERNGKTYEQNTANIGRAAPSVQIHRDAVKAEHERNVAVGGSGFARVEPEDDDYAGPSEAELKAAQDAAKADLDTVMALLESNDPNAALLIENERQRMELASVKSQRDGYMNQCNELIRRVKSLRKMLDKAQGK